MASELSIKAVYTTGNEKLDHRNDFFVTDTDHGFAKRVILHKILQAWFRIHFCTGYQKVCYVDGFAGEGSYGCLKAEDFKRATNPEIICKYGSPLIALHNIQDTFISITKGIEKLNRKKGITKEDLLSIEKYTNLVSGEQAWKNLRPPLKADMYLIDYDENSIQQLKAVMQQRTPADRDYDHDIMKCVPHYLCETFEQATAELQENILHKTLEHPIRGRRLQIPTFSFIDPFGYKQISMKTVQTYIGENKTALINVMVGFMHRFKSVPSQGDHITALFGTEKWRDIPDDLETREKYLWYAKLYENQLKERGAEFTLSFAMKDKGNQLKYYLIFATNELRILEKAKEALNRVTQESHSFEFSAYYVRKGQKEMKWSNDQNPNDVAAVIWQEYKGKRRVPVEEISYFVCNDTPFVHRTGPLKILYQEGKVSYVIGCEPRMKGSFPHDKGILVNFAASEDEALAFKCLQLPLSPNEEAKIIFFKYQGQTGVPVSLIKPKWKMSLKILLDAHRLYYGKGPEPKRRGNFPDNVLVSFPRVKGISDFEAFDINNKNMELIPPPNTVCKCDDCRYKSERMGMQRFLNTNRKRKHSN